MNHALKLLSLAAFAVTFAPEAARAEKFSCGFTEPFYTITYDTDSQKLVRTDLVMEKTTTMRNVSFQIVGAGEFTLKNRKGQELMRMKLTMNGSDGMSSTIYPYEATTNLLGGANNGVGGCSSSLLDTQEGEA